MPRRKTLIKPIFIEESISNIEPKNFYKISNSTSNLIDSSKQDTSQNNYLDSYYIIENEDDEKSNDFLEDNLDNKKKNRKQKAF